MKKKKYDGKRFSRMMSFLGFSGATLLTSCFPLCMYGTPTIEYQVKGRVLNEDGEGVEGIRIILSEPEPGDDKVYVNKDTVYTDKNGAYATKIMECTGSSPENDLYNVKMMVEDVDGQTNGEYESDDVYLGNCDFHQVKKDKDWYNGRFEYNADVVLKKADKKE